jgi:maleylacetate reductase
MAAFCVEPRLAEHRQRGMCHEIRGKMNEPELPRIDRRGLAALGTLLGEAGRRRVFVICGPGARHLERVGHELSGRVVQVFPEARRHVPSSLVQKAGEALAAFRADAVVSIGGGSATGLGKALRLEQAFFFVAVPTTYAGSELTDLYGMTSEGGKRTGRDARVVPDVALYDIELTRDMPLALSITSLLNALAHPISALSTQRLDATGVERPLVAAQTVYGAMQAIARDVRDEAGRRAAIDGTILAGGVLRALPVGAHHELAHALGGRFDLDHAGLHSVLLPHFVASLESRAPEIFTALERRLDDTALPRSLFLLLRASGAPTSLAALGARREGLAALLAERPHLPTELLEAAFEGRQP